MSHCDMAPPPMLIVGPGNMVGVPDGRLGCESVSLNRRYSNRSEWTNSPEVKSNPNAFAGLLVFD